MKKRIWAVGLLVTIIIAGCSSKQSGVEPTTSTTTAVTAGASSTVDASATADTSATADASATAQATGAKAGVKWKPLEIVESGYTVVDGSRIEYAFYLRNPNAGFGVQYPTVKVTMLDAAGGVVSTTNVTWGRWLMPGETAAFAGEAGPSDSRPAKVTFEPVFPDYKWKSASEAKQQPLGVLKTSRLKAKESASGVSFTGEVANTSQAGVDDFLVCIILRDKSKRIVAGYNVTIDELPPGSNKGPFQVDSVRKVPKFATFEAYAQRW